MAATNRLIELDDAGTSVWLDYIRRKLIESGELQRMVDEDGLRGMTSNPTIFEKAISGSSDYDAQIRELVEAGQEPLEIFQQIAAEDIRSACDVLRPLYDRLNRADGYVSLEVSPEGAADTERTLSEARHLWKLVDRPNVMIKVPGTPEGLPAIEQLLSEGINVNITLLFSVERYEEVMERFLRGLERRLEAGGQLEHIASVASFFVSRVDTAVDKKLQGMIEASDGAKKAHLEGLLGKAAIANAKVAYEKFQQIFTADRWKKLANAGAMVQRPLWASTSTKNPSYRDVVYVEELIGPHTVNTMPQATMTAFKDEGRVDQTLTKDVEQAHDVWNELREAGIDLDDVTHQLEVDGVALFADSFHQLIDCIEQERIAITMGDQRSESQSLGNAEAPVADCLNRLANEHFTQRLWEKDATLWSNDETTQAGIRGALGWLTIVEVMREQAEELEAFAAAIAKEGFEEAVVLGMGGSSLCPDVLSQTFSPTKGFPRLSILDTTQPDAVAAMDARLDLRRTLFIVSSKSGTTTEPDVFFRYFWGRLEEAGVPDAGSRFIAITDPGTPLEQEAQHRGFRKIFAGAPDIGGRYSALSNFGMVPAAMMGLPIRQLLDRAETMVQATQPCVAPIENPGVRLGAILGTLAASGRDKLTLVVDEAASALGWWIEQLIAESAGKSGKGILPVAGEKLGPPDVYGDDRLFVSIKVQPSNGEPAGRAQQTAESRLRELEASGQPVVTLELPDRFDLAAQFFLWEIATATAGHILGINAFDQPNVQESKDNTKALLKEFRESARLPEPEPVLRADGVTITGPDVAADELSGYLSEFLGREVHRGSYVALMAYIEPTALHSELLEKIRLEIRDRYHVATTVGFGPRFLHSTGQLHKGGPDEGVFIQLVCDAEKDLPIKGEDFTFGTLIAAQALGDYQSLQRHSRPVVRVNLGRDVRTGLEVLSESMAGVPTG